MIVNYDNITIEDCIEMYEKKGYITIIRRGQVLGFDKEQEDDRD